MISHTSERIKKNRTVKLKPEKSYALPVTISIVSVGVIALTLYLMLRKAAEIIDDINYDVENYDVIHGKPFIIR